MGEKRCVVGLVQMSCGANPEENLEKARLGIREAADRGARVIATPELFRTKYFCVAEEHANFDLAEPIPGPTTRVLGELAKQLRVTVIASVFERRMAGVYHNTAVLIGTDGEVVGKYRKMHIPDDPLYFEKFYFTPGDLGFRSWATAHGNVGMLVCWDQWFPEAARLTAMAGAEILFYPTAIGWHESEKKEWGESQHSAWETMQQSHAVANGTFVCAVNRVGREGTIEFYGQSFVCDPYGRVLVRGSADRDEVIVQEIDLGLVEEARRHWPFLRDRRIDAYGDLLKRAGDMPESPEE